MSDSSSFSENSQNTNNQDLEIAKPKPKSGFSSIFINEKVTPQERLKILKKYPSALESRNVFEDDNKEYTSIDTLLSEKIQLTNEVNNLLSEVLPLRQQVKYYCMQYNNDYDDPTGEFEKKKLKEKIENDQLEIEKIEMNIKQLHDYFTNKNLEFIKATIQNQRHEKSDLDTEILEIQGKLQQSEEKLRKLNNDYNKEPFDKKSDEISELCTMLEDMKKEEKDLLEEHERLLKLITAKKHCEDKLAPYRNQLKQLEHIRTRKSVELSKLKKDRIKHRQNFEAMMALNEKRARERKNREVFHRRYKKRIQEKQELKKKMQAIDDNQNINNMNQNNIRNPKQPNQKNFEHEIEYETVIRIVRRKRKHRHFHHHNIAHEEETIPDAIMFSTEVENTSSLRISQNLSE